MDRLATNPISDIGTCEEEIVARVLVLGVGNSLLADSGAGIRAALQLRNRIGTRPNVTILDAGTLCFSLLPALREADALIAIDAAKDGGSPGDVRICVSEDFDRFVKRTGRGVHEVGLADLLDVARLSGHLPDKRALISLEPASIDWGQGLSPPVAAALPVCVDVALEFIDRWQLVVASEDYRSNHSYASSALMTG